MSKILSRSSIPALVLTSVLLGASQSEAFAQLTINSTGTVSGTIVPPSTNPNFNRNTTRVDTDSQGRYFRNGVLVYSPQNPNLVGVDSSGRYFVDFYGIPVVSPDGTLTSPALSGQLTSVRRNHNVPVRFFGVIQDEFVVRGDYAGTATDPKTGQQYQGTFPIRGQGPRYSDANGGLSPTVFDFNSQYNLKATPPIPGTPTVASYQITNMPVRLTITIPAGLTPITTPSTATGGGTATPSPSIGADEALSSVFSNNQAFEVNRAVLESAQNRSGSIGPRSRVLLR